MNVSSLRQNLIRSKYFDSDLGTQDPVLTQTQILFGRKYFVNKVSNFGDGRMRMLAASTLHIHFVICV